MKRTDNYVLQLQSAQRRFLTYDQDALIAKFSLPADADYLYPVMFRHTYRLCRKTGSLQRREADGWIDANSHHEVMTLLDLLCDSRPDRYLSRRWKSMQDLGRMFHRNLLEDVPNAAAMLFDREPQRLHDACRQLGGTPMAGADISYCVELFDSLPIAIRFWHGDDEFAPRLLYLWDENTLMYLRYETTYFAIQLLLEHLTA